MNKIGIIGSFSTGKSTLAREIEQKGYKVSLDIERQAIELFCGDIENIQKTKALEFQKWIFEKQKENELSGEFEIFDNTIITILAYSYFSLNDDDFFDLFVKARDFLKTNPYDEIIYLPIEFDVDNDGIRNIDLGFQKAIDLKIKELLKDFGISYKTVKGGVEERIYQIIK